MYNEWERFNRNRVNAQAGSPDAQFYMGMCYLNGKNVVRDLTRAEKWLAMSASAGYREAMKVLKARFLYTDARLQELRETRLKAPSQVTAAIERNVLDEVKEDVMASAQAQEQQPAEITETQKVEALRLAAEHCNNAREQEALEVLRPLLREGDERATRIAEVARKRMSARDGEQAPAVELGTETLREVREKASQGDVAAQLKLAECYYNGHGVDRNYAVAVQWYRNAAEGGSAEAACRVGESYVLGNGVEVNYLNACNWFRSAAQAGHPVALYNLGVCYRNGWGVAASPEKEVRCYRQAADLGNGQAQYELGRACYYGYGCEQDLSAAHFWLARACNQNILGATVLLATLYENGFGVARDRTFAYSLLQKVVHAGSHLADGMLAKYYFYGEIAERDEDKAIELALSAIARGDKDTDNSMLLYRYYAKKRSYSEAFRWLNTARENGIKDACFELGKCYELGHGTPVDAEQAFRYYSLAEQEGDPLAYAALARCYKLGFGVERSAKLAKKYARLAKKVKV